MTHHPLKTAQTDAAELQAETMPQDTPVGAPEDEALDEAALDGVAGGGRPQHFQS